MPNLKQRNRREVKGRLDKYQVARPVYAALLGDGTSDENVEVTNRPGFVYIRTGNEQSASQAFNNRVPNRYDLPVYVGYTNTQPTLLQVLDIRQQAYVGAGNNPVVLVPGHHQTHEFGNSEDGSDVVWIEKQQYKEALAKPTDPASMQLYVNPILYQYEDGWQYYAGGNTADLSGYVPSTTHRARYLLVSIDAATNALQYTSGTVFNSYSPPSDLTDALPTPPFASIPVSAVYLRTTTTALTFEDNLGYDPRLIVSGTGGLVTAAPTGTQYSSLAASWFM